MTIQIHRLLDPVEVTRACADVIIDRLGRALVNRGSAVVGLSGGSTPKLLYSMLATYDIQWPAVHVIQVDERVAAADHPDRNWVEIHDRLVSPSGATGHPMPTTDESLSPRGLQGLAGQYEAELAELGDVDVVHLGLGSDGHTASLVPGDPVLALTAPDSPGVWMTDRYQGRRRMTLTAPAINAAQAIVWQVVGEDKRRAVRQLLEGDTAIPGSLIRQDGDVQLVLDQAASSQ